MDRADRSETPQSLTICPICAAELNASNLKKHLSKFHPRQSSFLCPVCKEQVASGEYGNHVQQKHKSTLLYSLSLRDKLLTKVLGECYISSSHAPDSYACLSCNQIVSKKRAFNHQQKVHKRDYLGLSAAISVLQENGSAFNKNPQVAAHHKNTRKPKAVDSINKSARGNCKEALDKLMTSGKVPLRVSQRLIINSAYWYGHPCGRPVNAPKHYENIQIHNRRGAYIDFGSNAFLIEQAAEKIIELCIKSINADGRLNTSSEGFIAEAKRIMSGSVYGVNRQYTSYRINPDGHMVFGTQSIHVMSFVKTITNCFNIRSRY